MVEIGNSVIPDARRQGYATEIGAALVVRAFEESSVQHVIAHTSDEDVPSTRVLLACGFKGWPWYQAGVCPVPREEDPADLTCPCCRLEPTCRSAE